MKIELSELISSLSYALDLTEGQPEGHCVRSCWIGMHVGQQVGLRDDELWSLYYTLLLKDLGCSSNAARICELYMSCDRSFKEDFKLVGSGASQMLRFVVSHTGPHARWSKRLGAIWNIVRNGDAIAQELIQTRCDRGASIARRLRFPETVAQAVHSLDEHFDGSGRPEHLRGAAIPRASQIALLAQVVDVFHFSQGAEAALTELQLRAGTWFDPALVDAFVAVARNDAFWSTLASADVAGAVLQLAPASHAVTVDEHYLDAIAEAFGQIVDAKSPFTAGHSERVGRYAAAIAHELGLPAERQRWVRRGALLHDVGKLGVSNTILDKPGRLDPAEWLAVQQHASYTGQILGRIAPLTELAKVAAAHHERLDGAGYPHGLRAEYIALETRIITVADIFDAITAERPYRGATSVVDTLQIMRASVGSAIDADCMAALERVLDREIPEACILADAPVYALA